MYLTKESLNFLLSPRSIVSCCHVEILVLKASSSRLNASSTDGWSSNGVVSGNLLDKLNPNPQSILNHSTTTARAHRQTPGHTVTYWVCCRDSTSPHCPVQLVTQKSSPDPCVSTYRTSLFTEPVQRKQTQMA